MLIQFVLLIQIPVAGWDSGGESVAERCGHCGEACCEYNADRYCLSPGATCQDIGQYIPEYVCVCAECGGLGQSCCPGNLCYNGIPCINGTCRYTDDGGGDEGVIGCGNFLLDVNGLQEGGRLYKVDQPQNIEPIFRSYPVPLLVHGMGSDCRAWNNYIQWFYDRGYRIGNVDLYAHESDYLGASTYAIFSPNGVMVKELSDSLKSYMESVYPDSLGWNNNIVAVAHSRGGLDVEDAIVLRGADIKGVVSLATPWLGSRMADVCAGSWSGLGCPVLCLRTGIYFRECMDICETLSPTVNRICSEMVPDSRILTTWLVSTYRLSITRSIQNSPIRYAGGIGYTKNMLCGGFEGMYVSGCLLLKYLFFEWANDGMVQGNSVYLMDYIYGSSKFEVMSPRCSSIFSCPSPGIWLEDHTRVRESYDIFNNKVEIKVRDMGSTQGSTSSGAVDYRALMEAVREARITRSAGYITRMSVGDSMNLKFGSDVGISGIVILSETMLQGINMDYCDSCIFKYSYRSAIKGSFADITVRAVDSGSVLIGFIPSEEWALAEMERDRIKYEEGDSAVLLLRLPQDDYDIKAYYINTSGIDGGVLQFKENKAVIRNLREGIYMVGVQVEGRVYRRTIIMYFPVEEASPPARSMGYRKGEKPHLSEGEYEVYDINGRLIYRGYTSNGKIRLEQMKKGIYIIRQNGKSWRVILR